MPHRRCLSRFIKTRVWLFLALAPWGPINCAHKGPRVDNDSVMHFLNEEKDRSLNTSRKASLELLVQTLAQDTDQTDLDSLSARNKELLRIKSIDSTNPYTYFFLGEVAAKLRQCDKARSWFAQAKVMGLTNDSQFVARQEAVLGLCQY